MNNFRILLEVMSDDDIRHKLKHMKMKDELPDQIMNAGFNSLKGRWDPRGFKSHIRFDWIWQKKLDGQKPNQKIRIESIWEALKEFVGYSTNLNKFVLPKRKDIKVISWGRIDRTNRYGDYYDVYHNDEDGFGYINIEIKVPIIFFTRLLDYKNRLEREGLHLI